MIAFAIGKGISAPLSFVLILVLASEMSRAEYANYVAAIALLEIGVVLGALGVDWVMQSVVAAVLVHGNAAQLRRAVLILGALPLAPYALLSAALWGFAPQVSAALGGVATVDVIRLYALVLALEGPTRILRDSLMATMLLQRTAQVSTVLRVATTFALAAVPALLGHPVPAEAVARAEIAAAGVALAAVLVALALHLVRQRPREPMDASIGRWLGWRSLRFASHAYGSLVMMFLLGTDVMTALVARHMGADATAAFGFVVRLTETARRHLPMDIFWGVLRPATIGRYEGNGRDVGQLLRDCHRMIDANLLVIGAGLAVAIAAGDALVELLSRGNVQAPAMLLALTLPLLASHTVRRTVELVAYARDRSGLFARSALASLAAPPLTALLLVGTGAVQAAPLAVLAVDLSFVGLAMAAMRACGEPIRFDVRRWARLAAAVAAGGAVGAVVARGLAPGGVGVPGVVGAVAAALAAFGAVVAALGVIGTEDRAWLVSLVRTRAGA
jgi:hypothetical protein